MQTKLCAFLEFSALLVVELALLYPSYLLDDWINGQVYFLFGSGSDGIAWAARAIFWISIPIILIAVIFGGQSALQHMRRRDHLKESLAEAAAGTNVAMADGRGTAAFRADAIVKLAVPDAIAAVDKKRNLLRLKAIGPYQDVLIDLAHVIGLEWRQGETRTRVGRQSFFRHFNPKYRTLREHPSIFLELATDGSGPVLEYSLLADPKDRKALRALFDALRHTTARPRHAKRPTTEQLLNALPLQCTKYGYGWI